MMKSQLFNTLLNSGLAGHGYSATAVSVDERQATLDALLRRNDICREDGPCVTVVEVESEELMYLITQQGHFAHPSILKRKLVTTSDGRGIEVSAQTCASMELAEKWLGQFQEQDRKRLSDELQKHKIPMKLFARLYSGPQNCSDSGRSGHRKRAPKCHPGYAS
jgi:hypothetical protein